MFEQKVLLVGKIAEGNVFISRATIVWECQ